jgi:Fe-only nitrogenase accessory protein AnfO
MAKEIAVFLGADGTTASPDELGTVSVFRRTLGAWELNREKPFFMGAARGMRELRLKMSEMLQFMDGCRIFVAKSITGVPYFELERAGCAVWEYEGEPSVFLEHVWQQEEKELEMEKMQASPGMPAPEERTPGNYYISIKEIQRSMPEVTSKQVLRQFICQGGFRTLEIDCGHVPPWLELEAACGRLTYQAEQLGRGEFRVKITKNTAGP